MKIISYNVNGIRAAIKKGFIEWLKNSNCDVICLQEIKANKDQIDLNLFSEIGYNYNYWFSAQKRDIVGWLFYLKKNPIKLIMEQEFLIWTLKEET